MNRKIKALIVDDSLLFRKTLEREISRDSRIQVIDTAEDVYAARDKILQYRPDVLTLDVEMPKMNGIEFLRKLIPQYPIPAVVVTSLPLNAFEALEAGAVDFINKPTVRSPQDMQNFSNELIEKIIIASQANMTARRQVHRPAQAIGAKMTSGKTDNFVIAIGASTGGTDATQAVLQGLPKNMPPIVVTQHMPANFTRMYAERLTKICSLDIREAKDGDRLKSGLVLIAPGELQMRVKKDANGYFVKVSKEGKVSGHAPSVDVLFNSVAEVAGKGSIGVIMTGMGQDGAQGLLQMKNKGAYTIGQDKASCVVYGMPMVAYNIGAVTKQVTLDSIAPMLITKANDMCK